MRFNNWKLMTLSVCLALGGAPALQAAAIHDYAAACDAEIGYSVPPFNCDNGTLVPGQQVLDPHNALSATDETLINTAAHEGPCESPQFLDEGNVCNPGSRVQILLNTPSAFIVAMCRKGGNSGLDNAGYEDIAVIQTSRITGATCFYQRNILNGGKRQPADVPDPSDPNVTLASGWKSPSSNMSVCTGCHDGVGIIRSPFIKSLLPGSFNEPDSPYWFAGKEAARLNIHPVSITAEGNECVTCHRVGTKMTFTPTGGFNMPYRSQYGNMRYSYMSVLAIDTLQLGGYYTALGSSTEKWWMPFGRTSVGPTSSHHASLVDYFQLEDCKKEFIESNAGRNLADGIIYPQGADCSVEPTPKFIRLQSNKDYRITNFSDSSERIYQYGSSPPYTGNPSTNVQHDLWRFQGSSSANSFQIRNRLTNRYICVNSDDGVLMTCSSSERYSHGYTWRLNPFNDYEHTNGIPSGRSFHIQNIKHASKYLFLNGAGDLNAGPLDAGALEMVWKIDPTN